eukprot:TRINITY_DN31960_c0_g1_i1.p1 TRINITY_DN31960_c0_g1~~TRINITY_DN31960_c0_g1_i1.p1  ORF type:complete len:261 (+),score=79.71 TRINITY_DN31960_c0_g1_i1:82-783(+)
MTAAAGWDPFAGCDEPEARTNGVKDADHCAQCAELDELMQPLRDFLLQSEAAVGRAQELQAQRAEDRIAQTAAAGKQLQAQVQHLTERALRRPPVLGRGTRDRDRARGAVRRDTVVRDPTFAIWQDRRAQADEMRGQLAAILAEFPPEMQGDPSALTTARLGRELLRLQRENAALSERLRHPAAAGARLCTDRWDHDVLCHDRARRALERGAARHCLALDHGAAGRAADAPSG